MCKNLTGYICIIVINIILLTSCASSPTGRSQMILKSDASLEQEGSRQFKQLRETLPLVQNPATIDYVACVTNAIVDVVEGRDADLYWELAVVDQSDVNAYVLPGGKIVVNSGILTMTSNQHQLAAVIGHEVAHVTARHANERASRAAVTDIGVDIAAIILGGGYRNQTQGARNALSTGALLGLLNPFSRLQETEADVVGIRYMAKAGFDPRESVELWKNMNKKNASKIPEYLSTHPSGETRIDDLIAQYPVALEIYNEAKINGVSPDCKL
jgi:predicted Zn-dependent protease